MSYRILQCDVIDGLRTLPDESVHCVVTSPPYYGLRDYGVAGQIGLEKTPQEFIAKIVAVFREVRRVLRSDGTCWVNMGDSYASSPNQRKAGDGMGLGFKQATNGGSTQVGSRSVDGLKPKDLMGMPWRVAFALQEDGWWLRQDIIWSKPNPMPESVTDRCTKAHEYLFLLSKSATYYFDQDAIRTEPMSNGKPTVAGSNTGPGSHEAVDHAKARTAGNKTHKFVSEYEASDSEEHRTKAGLLAVADKTYTRPNKRSVWQIPSQPFPEAHFATFPMKLVEPCIRAGCPEGGTVLDPFNGSGTTGLIAIAERCEYIGIELNAEYAAMSERRLYEATAQEVLI